MDAIDVRDLTKTYRIGVGRARVREMLPWPMDVSVRRLLPNWWTRNTFNALERLSLSVPSGSSLALVGHNGAGKTTLLKLIAGITSPTSGGVVTSGRVVALIDVLVGFHAELTGRENIYLMGSIYGFGRREMSARLDRVLDFAEIDELLDTPLKRYSAGMGARLGFGTLTALDADIVLVDEVLAVGDAAFQRKCMGWLDEYRGRGGTMVFVSHNLAMVRSMTDRAVWLNHGRMEADGPTNEVVQQYARAMEQRHVESQTLDKRHAHRMMRSQGTHRWGIGGTRVAQVQLDEDVRPEEGLSVSIAYDASDVDSAIFCVAFVDDAGRDVCASSSFPVRLHSGGGRVVCQILPFPLRSGIYFPVVAIVSPDGRVRDRWRLDRAIVVDGNGRSGHAAEFGAVELAGTWSHDEHRGGQD